MKWCWSSPDGPDSYQNCWRLCGASSSLSYAGQAGVYMGTHGGGSGKTFFLGLALGILSGWFLSYNQYAAGVVAVCSEEAPGKKESKSMSSGESSLPCKACEVCKACAPSPTVGSSSSSSMGGGSGGVGSMESVGDNLSPLASVNSTVQYNEVARQAKKILQIGVPRTGSTWQYQLLCVIMQLVHDYDVDCHGGADSSEATYQVLKSHSFRTVTGEIGKAKAKEDLAMFLTTNMEPHIQDKQLKRVGYSWGVIQTYDTLVKEGLAVIQTYSKLFGLTEHQTKMVYQYMKYWQITRRCCGNQQGQDNFKRLQNSTAPLAHKFIEYDYSDCAIYNLGEVETLLVSTEVIKNDPSAKEVISQISGSCKRTNDLVRGGMGFNGKVAA